MNDDRKVLALKITPETRAKLKALREAAKAMDGRNVTLPEVIKRLIDSGLNDLRSTSHLDQRLFLSTDYINIKEVPDSVLAAEFERRGWVGLLSRENKDGKITYRENMELQHNLEKNELD